MPPMLWAHGDCDLNVTPFRSDAERDQIPQFLTLIGRLCDARLIGRSAEAWVTMNDPSWDHPSACLEQRVQSDPMMRTAILVQACDVDTGDGVMLAAITGLNDMGERWWETTEPSYVSERISGELSKALDDLRRIGPIPRHNINEIIPLAESMFVGLGWVLVAS